MWFFAIERVEAIGRCWTSDKGKLMAEALANPKIAELTEGMAFDGFYVVRDSSLQTAINGKQYIRLSLGDATGVLPGNMWDATQEMFQCCVPGDVIKVRAMTEMYKNKLQAKVVQLRSAHSSEVDPESFLPRSPADLGKLREGLLSMVDALPDPDYRALGKSFFDDRAFLDRFSRTPAAKENHHAYIGGLLEHSMHVAALAENFAQSAPVNRDLLVLGAILHDVGKVEELSAVTTIEYTDVGRLIGHLVLGSIMVERRAATIEGFPEMKRRLIQHLILSHHGRFEYGSPVLPKTPEALALHHLDNLDAKVEAARRIITQDTDGQRSWTDKSWMLETMLYKGLPDGKQ